MVKLDLGQAGQTRSDTSSCQAGVPLPAICQSWHACVCMRKTYKLLLWLGHHGLYPLLVGFAARSSDCRRHHSHTNGTSPLVLAPPRSCSISSFASRLLHTNQSLRSSVWRLSVMAQLRLATCSPEWGWSVWECKASSLDSPLAHAVNSARSRSQWHRRRLVSSPSLRLPASMGYCRLSPLSLSVTGSPCHASRPFSRTCQLSRHREQHCLAPYVPGVAARRRRLLDANPAAKTYMPDRVP